MRSIKGCRGVGGVKVQGVQGVERVWGVYGGVGVFLKNLLHMPSCHRFLCQVVIGSYAKLSYLYNPFSFSYSLMLISGDKR